MGLGDRWPEIARTYAEVNLAFGDIVKVTPSSKVVGDLAIFLVTHEMTVAEFEKLAPDHQLAIPNSVIDMFEGSLGVPDGGWPPNIQADRPAREEPLAGRPGALLEPVDLAAAQADLARKLDREPDARRSHELPHVPRGVFEVRPRPAKPMAMSKSFPPPQFFYRMEKGEEITIELEPGKTLVIKFLTVGEPRPDALRTVFFELNGRPREVDIKDRSTRQTEEAKAKADPAKAGEVGAPLPGLVTIVAVHLGQAVNKGDRLLVLEAMKMQSTVYSPVDGKVAKLTAHAGLQVEAKDLLLVIE